SLFEGQVERTPEATALVLGNEQLTYRQLNARANQLACHLRHLGVGTEVLVGLCIERSVEMIVAVLGILKAGGAFVPLDPTYPQGRLSFIVQNAGLSILVTQQHLLKTLLTQNLKTVCLDSDRATIAGRPETNLQPAGTQDLLAYVIYTSGSTGQ